MSSLEDRYALRGRTVLVTGATGSIGRAICSQLADCGARLALTGHDEAGCRMLHEHFAGHGHHVWARAADLRDRNALVALVDQVNKEVGPIDVLVSNAGIAGPMGSIADATDADWQALYDVNLRSSALLAGLLGPAMAARGRGSMVFTASIAGLRGNRRIGLYGMTKAALIQLARNAAVEWGPGGVRANAVAPGLIATGWEAALLSDAEAWDRRMAQTPLRRIGEAGEVAAAVVFLASDAASFISGQILVVDGGTLTSDGN